MTAFHTARNEAESSRKATTGRTLKAELVIISACGGGAETHGTSQWKFDDRIECVIPKRLEHYAAFVESPDRAQSIIIL